MKLCTSLLLFYSCSLSCCTSSKKNAAEIIKVQQNIRLADSLFQMQKQGIDFYAAGDDPVAWELAMDFDKGIDFSSKDGILVNTPAVKGSRLTNLHATSYKSSVGSGQLNIVIFDMNCNDARTPGLPDKKVEVTFLNKRYTGCGKYLYDNRVNDHWVLEKINNTIQEPTAYSKGLPFMEFNLKENKLLASDGCNRITGLIEMRGSRIAFSALTSTKIACKNNPAEKIFQQISNQLVDYYIKNDRLVLYLIDDSTLTFTRG